MSADSKAAYQPMKFRVMTPEEIAAQEAAPHPSDFVCQCDGPVGDREYTLLIEEGKPSLTCTSCGKPFDYAEYWGEEALTFGPVPVTLTVHVEHGYSPDDVYVYCEAEPALNAPYQPEVDR